MLGPLTGCASTGGSRERDGIIGIDDDGRVVDGEHGYRHGGGKRSRQRAAWTMSLAYDCSGVLMSRTRGANDAVVLDAQQLVLGERLERKPPTPRRRLLKWILIGSDAVALLTGWGGAFWLLGVNGPVAHVTAMLFALLGAAIGFVALAARRLWLARVCEIRSMEIRLLAHACVTSAIAMIVLYEIAELEVSTLATLCGAVASFFLLMGGRGMFRWRLRAYRKRGRLRRPLVLVGWNAEAEELLELLDDHPESGFDVVGLLSDSPPPAELQIPWIGSLAFTTEALRRTGATGALVVGSALSSIDLNAVTRRLLQVRAHVHLASGLRGIAHGRIRVMPLAFEPLMYVEPAGFSRMQLVVKRTVDIVVASVIGTLALPVLALAAIAIKLDDGGPLVFRQRRVGKDGRSFTLFKLRTMVPSAEEQLASLRELNGRAGPLFKMRLDPRVTRVGRVLRATSIDELPQLLNVMFGSMSLVGPRPALPSEMATFDEQLRGRASVLPGITGLWQVEARDDPSFARYRRLDLYYVDNWSVGLDFSVLISTFGVVSGRAARYLRARLTGESRRPSAIAHDVLE
ncbi:hypothetical protein BH23ACT10_BH23ACT10_06940 [soil metagenome]